MVGVVFAALRCRESLADPQRYRGCLPVGRSGCDADQWCLHEQSCLHMRSRRRVAGVPGELRTADAPPARSVNLVGSGWPSAAMMPILLKSVGRDKPQYRVRKSTRFSCGEAELVLAMHAGDEAASMDNVMNQSRWLKVGRDRPQLCARESTEFLQDAGAPASPSSPGCRCSWKCFASHPGQRSRVRSETGEGMMLAQDGPPTGASRRIAQNDGDAQRQRQAHHPARQLPCLAVVPRHGRVHLRPGQTARHHAQAPAPRHHWPPV